MNRDLTIVEFAVSVIISHAVTFEVVGVRRWLGERRSADVDHEKYADA